MQKKCNIKKIAFTVSCPYEVLSNAYYLSKIKFRHIYGRTFTKYLHGTWSLLNILMIFGIKEKSIILNQTMYCWLLLQIYHAAYDWFCSPFFLVFVAINIYILSLNKCLTIQQFAKFSLQKNLISWNLYSYNLTHLYTFLLFQTTEYDAKHYWLFLLMLSSL